MTRDEALEGQRCLRIINEFMMDYYQKHKNNEQYKKNNK